MSVTAVPLQPIRRGSLLRLWFGVLLVLMLATALAWVGLRQFGSTADGLHYQMFDPGKGDHPAKDDIVLVSYKFTLPDGTMIQESPDQGVPLDLSQQGVIPGFVEAMTLMRKGGHMRVTIPAKLGYADHPPQGSDIPDNSPLVYDLKLLDFRTRAEVMEFQRQQQLQQMMQQQGGSAAPQH